MNYNFQHSLRKVHAPYVLQGKALLVRSGSDEINGKSKEKTSTCN